MRTFESRARDRGFALIATIVMISLVGMALLAASKLFVSEAARTRCEATEAQLRQLLLAGQVIAADRLATGQVELPQVLREGQMSVRIEPQNGAPTVRVTALSPHGRSAQTLTYEPSELGVRVATVVLEP